MPEDDGVLAALVEQLGELQMEVATLKASLHDERWKQVADNFKQLSDNLIHLDTRFTSLESKVDERLREDVPADG